MLTLQGATEPNLSVINEIASQAFDDARRLLPTLNPDLELVVMADRFVIPETGERGASISPGKVEWHVDPARPEGIAEIAKNELRATLFHELHHQARGWVMKGGEPPTRFVHGPVCEGLASAFERDAAGRRAPWAEYPADVDEWVRELLSLPLAVNYPDWMFHHPDGRRWIGYRAGTYIADRAIAASERSAADLATTPTERILELAGY